MKHATAVVIAFICAPLHADQLRLSELLAVAATRVESITVSPDGRSAVAVIRNGEGHYNEELIDVRPRSLLYFDLVTGRSRRLASDCSDVRNPAWSPDGTRLAHFARRNGFSGVSIRSLSGTSADRWIDLHGESANPLGEVASLVWSDDGTRLAVVHEPGVSWMERFLRRMNLSIAELRAPIVIDSESARTPLMSSQGFDGSFFTDQRKRVAIIDEEGEVLVLSWSPLAEVQLLRLTADRLIARAGREIVTIVLSKPGEPVVVAQDVVLADSKHILQRKDGELIVTRPGVSVDVEPDLVARVGGDPSLKPVAFTDSGEVLALRERGMSSELLALGAGREPRVISGGEAVVRRSVSSRGGATVFAVATGTEPESLWVWRQERAGPSRIGSWNGTPPLDVRVERVSWNAADGTPLEGLLVTPEERRGPLPTLLYLHGGPEDRVRFDLHYLATLHEGGAALSLAARGWAVFLPNFRGSLGYGEEPRRALQNGRYLSVPAADSLAGLSALIDRGIADETRLAVAGFSFGGTLTAWLIGREHRFRAAAAMAGDLDLLGDDRARLRGDRAMHALGGVRSGPEDGLLDAWHAPDKYGEMSPLERAVDVTTPTLLLSTAMEQLSGTGQAAFFNGASLDGTPVRWIYYPSAWHGGGWSLEDRVDATSRVIEWLERWTFTAAEQQ